MKRFFIFALIAIAAVALLMLTVRGVSSPEATATPYAAALLNNGQPISVTSLQGKTAVLSSWATWCTECQHELPSLETLWESRKNNGLMVVAVNIDVDGANPAIGSMIDTMKLSMPIWRDADNNYSTYFAAPGVPTSVLLDSSGKIVKTWFGRTDFQSQDVLASIDAALKG